MLLEDIRDQLCKIPILNKYHSEIQNCDPGLVYRVPNVIRYHIGIDSNSGFTIYSGASRDKDSLPIILVLESPHTKEYEDLNDLQPAKGPTGCHIYNQLTKLIKKLLSVNALKTNKTYNFCIVNPVPYQASLGGQDNEKTVAIWKAIWEELDYKERFLQLITDLASGTVVLNACTNKFDRNGYNIKDEVQQVIGSNSNLIKYKLNHPSSDSYSGKAYTQSINNIL